MTRFRPNSALVALLLVVMGPGIASLRAEDGLHDRYDALLKKYVVGTSVDYARFHRNAADLEALYAYVDTLERVQPESLSRDAQLAYWINLYNAATLELILRNYPLESIKDIGGLFDSPWEREVVTVAGEALTLNAIENDIIRPRFQDARIHFAVNCAAKSCPPLADFAYRGSMIDTQLDAVTRQALTDSRWLEITDNEIRISKILDWYKDDFVEYSGSIRDFLSAFRPEDRDRIMDEDRDIEVMDYDWKLNGA